MNRERERTNQLRIDGWKRVSGDQDPLQTDEKRNTGASSKNSAKMLDFMDIVLLRWWR